MPNYGTLSSFNTSRKFHSKTVKLLIFITQKKSLDEPERNFYLHFLLLTSAQIIIIIIIIIIINIILALRGTQTQPPIDTARPCPGDQQPGKVL